MSNTPSCFIVDVGVFLLCSTLPEISGPLWIGVFTTPLGSSMVWWWYALCGKELIHLNFFSILWIKALLFRFSWNTGESTSMVLILELVLLLLLCAELCPWDVANCLPLILSLNRLLVTPMGEWCLRLERKLLSFWWQLRSVTTCELLLLFLLSLSSLFSTAETLWLLRDEIFTLPCMLCCFSSRVCCWCLCEDKSAVCSWVPDNKCHQY